MTRLSFFAKTYLLFMAALLDLAQIALAAMFIGLILNPILSFLFYASQAILFYTHGIPILHAKRNKALVASFVAEMIPVIPVGVLPLITINTWWSLRQIDKEIDAEEEAQAQAAAAQQEEEDEETYEEAA